MKRQLADIGRWLFYFPMRSALARLPLTCLFAFARVYGVVSYLLRPGRKKIASEELVRLFPEPDRARTVAGAVRSGFIYSAYILFQSFQFPGIRRTNIDRYMELNGEDHLKTVLERGKGAIILLIHFGANQMVMAGLGYRGYAVNQIGSRPEDWSRLSGIQPSAMDQKIFQLRLDLEKTLPANFIYIDGNMRPVFECLKKNELILMAVDGRAARRFVSVPVGSMMMNLSAGAFRIAHATGAPLIPVFPVCNKKGRHTLHIEPPISISSAHRDTFILAAASEYGRRIGARLQAYPDHYCLLMAEARLRSCLDPVPLFQMQSSEPRFVHTEEPDGGTS